MNILLNFKKVLDKPFKMWYTIYSKDEGKHLKPEREIL